MLSVIISTRESERVLVPTLACLVPGATAGLVREVILADAGSTDETEAVGDVAGCRFLSILGAPGPRLQSAAAAARSEWLMVLPAGAVLDPGWVENVQHFIERAPPAMAAVFGIGMPLHGQESMLASLVALWRARRARLSAGRGLILSKVLLAECGGYRDRPDPESDLLRRIGKSRLLTLRAGLIMKTSR